MSAKAWEVRGWFAACGDEPSPRNAPFGNLRIQELQHDTVELVRLLKGREMAGSWHDHQLCAWNELRVKSEGQEGTKIPRGLPKASPERPRQDLDQRQEHLDCPLGVVEVDHVGVVHFDDGPVRLGAQPLGGEH